MQKCFRYCGITAISFALVACNGGGSSSNTPSTPSQISAAQPTPTPTSAPVISTPVSNGGRYHGRAASTLGSVFFGESSGTIPPNDPGIAESAATPVGWSTSTNSLAPINCWDYNATLTNPTGSTSLGDSQTTSQFETTLDTSVSASAEFGIFSASADTSYSSMKSQDSSSVSSFSSGSANYILRATIRGLNTFGQMILNNQPQNFKQICGDRIINNIPVKLQSGINIVFSSSDSSTTSNLSTEIKAGVGIADLSTTIKNQKNAASNHASVVYHLFDYGDPSLFPDLSNAANSALVNCLDVTKAATATAADCDTFLSAFSSNFTQSVTNARTKFALQNGSNWGSLYTLDNAAFSTNLKLVNLNDYLSTQQQSQLNVIQNNSLLVPYLSEINHNLAVLSDLDVAKTIFAKVIANYHSDSFRYTTSTFQKTIVLEDYNRAINGAYTTLYQQLGNCIYARDSVTAENNCGVLSSTSTVGEYLESSLNPLSKNVWYYPEYYGLLLTIKGMIYDVTITNPRQAGAATPTFTGSLPQLMVFIPYDATNLNYSANTESNFASFTNWGWSNFDLSAHNPLFGLAFNQVTDKFFSPSLIMGNANSLGQINIFDFANILNNFWAVTYTDVVSSAGNDQQTAKTFINTFTIIPNVPNKPTNCSFFKNTSQGCNWSLDYTNEFTRWWNPGSGEQSYQTDSAYVINIKDNSVRNVFKTLYPFN